MTYLPSLPDGALLLDVFRAYPETSRPLLDYHQALMRGPSLLSVAERCMTRGGVRAVQPYERAGRRARDHCGEDYFAAAARRLAATGYTGLKDLL
jgi:hypothetical protein